jgi:hypothetical protein
MNQYHTPLVVNQPMNVTSASAPKPLYETRGYAIQAVYTGSSIDGTIYLTASCDPLMPDYVPDPVNFTTIANSSFSITSAGVFIWNVQAPYYNYVVVNYTDASGGTSNGILNVSITAKDF